MVAEADDRALGIPGARCRRTPARLARRGGGAALPIGTALALGAPLARSPVALGCTVPLGCMLPLRCTLPRGGTLPIGCTLAASFDVRRRTGLGCRVR